MLLIATNEETIQHNATLGTTKESVVDTTSGFEQPRAFRAEFNLHAHQERGVQWLQHSVQSAGRQGVLLADDMGVGKTIQILTFLAWCIESGKFPDLSAAIPPFRPILIIVPLILLETRTWEREMERFFAEQGAVFWPVLALHGSDLGKFRRDNLRGPELELGQPVLDLARLQRYRLVITNYETVKNYQHSFAYFINGKSLWSIIVSDESQEYKVPSSKLSHTMKALKADFQVACTGTPVENRLLDLWNIFDSIQPGLLFSAKDFVERFEKQDNETERASRLKALKRLLLFQQPNAFILRRNKSDVTTLPPKRISKVKCEMSEAEISLHQQLLDELRGEDKKSGFLSVLQRFAQLSQHAALLSGDAEDRGPAELVAGSSKLRSLIEQLHTIRGAREKAIIFARHRSMQSILAKVLAAEFRLPIRIVNGDTKRGTSSLRASSPKTRNEILEEFKIKPGFNVLVLSPFVAGVGLTITEANHVFHYGRWWNPAVESQATDRAYRIGQDKEVFVYIPILHDPSGKVAFTFDERLDALMERKYQLAEDFLKPLPPESELGSELLEDLIGDH
jgi:SNF2 family DNA or RNA helicase